MKKMWDILKGISVGLASVVPGLSGGTLAVMVGIYKRIIEAIATFSKRPIWAIRSIWFCLIGIGIGLVVAVFGVSYFYEKAPIVTAFLFIGLIVGSVPVLTKQVKFDQLTPGQWVVFGTMILVVAAIPFLQTGVVSSLQFSLSGLFTIFLLGAIAATTMIVPGISGSMMLIVFGYYEVLLTTIKEFYIGFNSIYIIVFLVGALFGIVLFAKFIRYLLTQKQALAMSAILAMVIASPIPIVSYLNFQGIAGVELIIAIIAMFVGFFIAYQMSHIKAKS